MNFISVPPQILPFDFGEDVLNSGESTSLQCSIIKGDLPIDIVWLHNGKPVENGAGLTMMRMNKKISMLSIDPINAEHSGEFTCLAKNKAGSTSHSAMLLVNGNF